MRPQSTTNIVTYGVLTIAAAASIILPASLGPRQTTAAPPVAKGETTLTLNTVVRDFKEGTPDFGSGSSGGNGHVAGNVMTDLGPNGTPVFVGLEATPLTDFKIVNSALIPQKPFAAMVTFVGAAFKSCSVGDPVTVRGIVGSTAYDPFGSFNTAIASNVNGIAGPRSYVIPTMYPAGTAINISGSSWVKKSSSYSGALESHWKVGSSYTTTAASPNIKVLRNGDTVPSIAGASGQMSVEQYLTKYINATTKMVTIKTNQVIYLFELGTNGDFQDLVILVTLGESANYLASLDASGSGGTSSTTAKGYKVQSQWRDSTGHAIPPHLFGTSSGDVAGTKGSASSGGISTGASFDHWYTDVMGTNLSGPSNLQLKKNNGVWEYLTNDFHPIDGAMFGNEGEDHNYYFTMNFGVDFTHHAGEHRFIEFQGDDDVWVYIDGKLVMDLGGISPGVKQFLDVDRLPGLTDGAKHHIEFFYAQRQENTASFNLRTNLDLGEGTTETYTITGAGD